MSGNNPKLKILKAFWMRLNLIVLQVSVREWKREREREGERKKEQHEIFFVQMSGMPLYSWAEWCIYFLDDTAHKFSKATPEKLECATDRNELIKAFCESFTFMQ